MSTDQLCHILSSLHWCRACHQILLSSAPPFSSWVCWQQMSLEKSTRAMTGDSFGKHRVELCHFEVMFLLSFRVWMSLCSWVSSSLQVKRLPCVWLLWGGEESMVASHIMGNWELVTMLWSYGNCFTLLKKIGFQLRFALLSVKISGNLKTLVQIFHTCTINPIT